MGAPAHAERDKALHLLGDWQITLRDQSRMSDHTIAAYRRDVEAFLAFLEDHLGHPPHGRDLTALHLSLIHI